MMKSINTLIATAIVSTALFAPLGVSAGDKLAVNITPDMGSADVMHNGKKTTIMRNQDQKNTVNPSFAKTSRKCPPFCIQPAVLDTKARNLQRLKRKKNPIATNSAYQDPEQVFTIQDVYNTN